MSICWYCHWGWPKPVADIYREAINRLEGDWLPLDFGPGHIVWSDENFGGAEWCLDNFDLYRGDYTDQELDIVRWSLEELAKIPLGTRECVPDDYDGEHPDIFPPKIEMVENDIIRSWKK